MGYVPKSLSTPFKIQTVSLSALSSESAASSEADAQTSVCPVRALRIYIDRSASFRQSNQLFVCYGGCARGRAVSKQRLSHWIVDAITAAYTNQGLECPLHIRGHSTRAWHGFLVGLVERYVYSRYVLQPAGLLRILSPGFTGWTFSLLPPRCCR